MSTTTRSSHAAGAQVALTDQVAAVKEVLGPKLAGFTFGVSLTTVDRWALARSPLVWIGSAGSGPLIRSWNCCARWRRRHDPGVVHRDEPAAR